MINAKELRLGNIIEANGPPMEVKAITEHEVELYLHGSEADNWSEGLENCNGIPLSAEILEKAGFEIDKYGRWSNIITIDVFRDDKFWFYYSDEERIELKSLHQLQNLYFALTGEELPVEL